MKIRMKLGIGGTFHGVDNVQRGDVVEVDDVNGMRYCRLGYAEPYSKSEVPVEYATESVSVVETAVADVPVTANGMPEPLDEEPESEDDAEPEPQPEDEPEPEPEVEAAKARVAAKRTTRRR